MIYVVLLSILYTAIGYLFEEAIWNAIQEQDEMEELVSITPEELLVFPFAVARFLTALFWPFLIVYAALAFMVRRAKGKTG